MRHRGAILVTIAVLLALAGCARSPGPVAGPIVLVVVDTLRADHLPCYGYGRPTAPHMCAIGDAGVRFSRAYTVRTCTTPSIASMLTGLPLHRHGVLELMFELPAGVGTIADTLRAAGWATGGFVSSFVMIGELTGFSHGFEVYDDDVRSPEAHRDNYQRDAVETVDRALAWLRRAGPHSFLFVHLIEPHGPYTPPEPYRTRFALPPDDRIPGHIPPYQRDPQLRSVAEYVGRYDGEIASADEQVGRLVAALREWGWYEGATLLLIADHGESMGEEGRWFEHCRSLDDAEARVPLLVKFAGASAPRGVVDAPVSAADVAPTLLVAAGLDPARPGLIGADLRAVASGQPRLAPPPTTELSDGLSTTFAVHAADCTTRWQVPVTALRDGDAFAAAWAAGGVASPSSPGADPACAAGAAAELRWVLADRAGFRPTEVPRVHRAMQDLANRKRFVDARAAREVPIDAAGHEALRQLGYVK